MIAYKCLTALLRYSIIAQNSPILWSTYLAGSLRKSQGCTRLIHTQKDLGYSNKFTIHWNWELFVSNILDLLYPIFCLCSNAENLENSISSTFMNSMALPCMFNKKSQF